VPHCNAEPPWGAQSPVDRTASTTPWHRFGKVRDLLCDDDSARSLPIKQDERMGGVRACWAGMAASCASPAGP
jgi:hypothetical protein